MFIDASALTAILTSEQDARELLARMQNCTERLASPLAIWETTIAVGRRLGLEIRDAQCAVEDFFKRVNVEVCEVCAVPDEARDLATDAYARYGKGRHPAALNSGDCFAYACARVAKAPLLYKGDDFPQTDIETA